MHGNSKRCIGTRSARGACGMRGLRSVRVVVVRFHVACAVCTTTPTVDTSSVGSPRFCVSQARVCARGLSRYWVPTRSCRLPGHPHSCVELYVRLRGAKARVPKGARHGPAAVWSAGVVLVGLHSFLACVLVERQLDLMSVAARLRGNPVWFVRVSSWCREPVFVARVWRFPTLARTPGCGLPFI
ncbi:hypothetical protein Taro_035677 [Colocasia esculenta]|uniref:Uncharacterized protein n=1 Tax=Colocasia esculenta TaxID=4460 RepID=A0A843W7D6_COLES|nr:hypothetical protein [Colocasia esculenta]